MQNLDDCFRVSHYKDRKAAACQLQPFKSCGLSGNLSRKKRKIASAKYATSLGSRAANDVFLLQSELLNSMRCCLSSTYNTMSPIEWLREHSPAFNNLSADELTTIMHFTLLWSFFEGRALDTRASANSILALAHKWASDGCLDIEPFSQSLEYFRDRYFKEGLATKYFNGLNLRSNDNRELVEVVLKRENSNPADCVAALLIVVFRLRNNLFHGHKWNDGIRDQKDNFSHANMALMGALKTYGNI